jgi:hypothetical protein
VGKLWPCWGFAMVSWNQRNDALSVVSRESAWAEQVELLLYCSAQQALSPMVQLSSHTPTVTTTLLPVSSFSSVMSCENPPGSAEAVMPRTNTLFSPFSVSYPCPTGRRKFDKTRICIKCKTTPGRLVIRHAVYCKCANSCWDSLLTSNWPSRNVEHVSSHWRHPNFGTS